MHASANDDAPVSPTTPTVTRTRRLVQACPLPALLLARSMQLERAVPLIVAVLVACLHYLGIALLTEVLRRPRTAFPRARFWFAVASVTTSCCGFILWLVSDAARRRSRGTIAWTLGWCAWLAWTTYDHLRPQYGDLTAENLLFFITVFCPVVFYLVTCAAKGVAAVVRMVSGSSAASTKDKAGATPTTRRGAALRGPLAGLRGSRVGAAVAVLLLVGLVLLVNVGTASHEGPGDALRAWRGSLLLRGILGAVHDPCGDHNELPTLPTVWSHVVPRRTFNFYTGSEFCPRHVAFWQRAYDLDDSSAASTTDSTDTFASRRSLDLPEVHPQPPVSFIDERTGVLLVRNTCGALGRDPEEVPTVVAVDMAQSDMGMYEGNPELGESQRNDLRLATRRWHDDVARSFRLDDPKVRPGVPFTVNGTQYRFTGQHIPHRAPQDRNVPYAARGDVVIEYVLEPQAAFQGSAIAAGALYRGDGLVPGSSRRLAAGAAATEYDVWVNEDIDRFVRLNGGAAARFFVLQARTAHTIVRCGGEQQREEHRGYPVDYANSVDAVEADERKLVEPVAAHRNIHMLILDAVGRPTAPDYLPATVSWLQRRVSGGTRKGRSTPAVREFGGFTTVGHSTAPNQGAIFTGMTGWYSNPPYLKMANLFEVADRAATARRAALEAGAANASSEANATATVHGPLRYSTAMVSAMCTGQLHDILAFHDQRPGSEGSTFGGPYGTAEDVMMGPLCNRNYGAVFGNWVGPYGLNRRCFGREPVHRFILAYSRSITYQQARLRRANPNAATMYIGTLMEGHEGSRAVLRTADDDLRAHLNALEAMGVFRDATVMLLSDHGNHMGPFFEATEAGKMERAMPFLVMSVPVPPGSPEDRALAANAKQPIVTMFDLHATLRDLLGLGPTDWTRLNHERDDEQAGQFRDLGFPFGAIRDTSAGERVKLSDDGSTVVGNAAGRSVEPPEVDVYTPTLHELCGDECLLKVRSAINGQSLLRPFTPYTSCAEAGADPLCSMTTLCRRMKPLR